MERFLENWMDDGLESIASQLHFFSIGLGAALLIAGLLTFLTHNGDKRRKGIKNAGTICLIVGLIAIISGILQL